MNKIKVLISLVIILLVVGCNVTNEKEKSIEIVASYRERLALAPGSQVVAILEDVSKMDVASDEISRISIPAENSPIKLTINYLESDIQKGHRYNVRVKILNGDKLLFTSTEAYDPFSSSKKNIIELIKIQ